MGFLHLRFHEYRIVVKKISIIYSITNEVYTKYLFLIIAFLFSSDIVRAQEKKCISDIGYEAPWNGQIGGKLLPAEGTIRALFLFAEFPDDNYDINNPLWPKGGIPNQMNYWVDATWSNTPTLGSLTHYFNEMSFNRLKFIGNSYKVTIPYSRKYYTDNNLKYGDINRDIIKLADNFIDFDQYDNWDYESDYVNLNRKDGIVDLIFIIYRNIENDGGNYISKFQINRYADLGWGSIDIKVDNNLRLIKTGYWPSGNIPGGSGATLIDFFSADMKKYCIHEFAHYLQGGNEEHTGYAFWGMLSDWGSKSYIANSFERYRLGWINLNSIPNSTQVINNAILTDYTTTGISYKLIYSESSSLYFYLENHQKLSYWENVQTGNIENGLYILRQNGKYGKNIELIPADGRFNWTVNQMIANPWGSGQLPVFNKNSNNRESGYHDCQFIPWSFSGISGISPIHFIENSSGQAIEDVRYNGDGKDAFRIGYQEVFTPWSNPSSKLINNMNSHFGIQVKEQIGSNLIIDIFLNTAINASPSKPLDFTLAILNNHPYLHWAQNIEPDLQYYKIYKKNYEDDEWRLLSTTINNFYLDEVENISPRIPHKKHVRYKIGSVDNTNKESLSTEEKIIDTDGVIVIEKQNSNNTTNLDYTLLQNYPNPFNPSTTINFSIKESGFVKLKIYDLLGQEIQSLVQDYYNAGNYNVLFNSKSLSSGTYIYILEVNGQKFSKKMNLVR